MAASRPAEEPADALAGGGAAPSPLARFLEARSALAERVAASGDPAPLLPPLPLGEAGLASCERLAEALDSDLAALAAAHERPGFALVAIGGYGRREQCRHSDIDLMLLFAGEPDRVAIDGLLYPLWDAGLKVGHSVRTPEQATAAAQQNVETLTSLLDARLVAGDEDLYERFLRDRRSLVRRQRRWMLGELAHRRAQLVADEPWQLQEPDVKSGRGGLRELQAATWLGLAERIARDEPAEPLPRHLASARETLLITRNALHALDERPNDRYRQDLTPRVAARLGVERQRWGRRLFAAMREVDAVAGERLRPAPPRFSLARLLPWQRGDRTTSAHGPRSDVEHLREALEAAAPAALDPLPRSDWLERLLPEWEALRCRPHIAPFHQHPVDVHVWRTVAEARRATEEDLDGTETPSVAARLSSHEELLLGALLHDIGKGRGEDHSEAGAVIVERFATRAGLDDEVTRRLASLARHHLLLPTVATRRDISDARVIRETAATAGDSRTLDLLYLVSVADARATGPDVWSAWKAQLMRSLYERVRDELTGGEQAETSATGRRREQVLEALSGSFPREVVIGHLDQLPPGYTLSTPPTTIGRHLALIEEAAGGTALEHDRLGDVDRLTLVTPDRTGILSAVAGTLAAHNVNVLGGTAYTRDDGVAIEVMYVGDALGRGIDERRWGRVLEAVPAALGGQLAVEERLAETRRAYARATGPAEGPQIPTVVQVDNAGSEAYSIVEVHAADRLGLLYAITTAMLELQLDIHLAKVDTIGPEVVDAFYVQRRNGRRIEEADEIERLVRRVTEAVHALDEVTPTGG